MEKSKRGSRIISKLTRNADSEHSRRQLKSNASTRNATDESQNLNSQPTSSGLHKKVVCVRRSSNERTKGAHDNCMRVCPEKDENMKISGWITVKIWDQLVKTRLEKMRESVFELGGC